MTEDLDAPAAPRDRRGLQSVMTARLAGRQFALLLAAGTALLFVCFFINFYGASWSYWWDRMPLIQYRFFVIHPLLIIVYGYVLLNGVLFALGPSERSFGFFFNAMVFALVVVNYDNSIIDWFVSVFGGARFRIIHIVQPFKILFASLFFLAVIAMHYNVLSDDFARRMLRRGVPTDEVAQVRPGMFKVMVPTVLTAGAIATGLSVLGWLVSAVLRDTPLFVAKLEFFIMAGLLVPIAFTLRSILKEILARRATQRPPSGPNR